MLSSCTSILLEHWFAFDLAVANSMPSGLLGARCSSSGIQEIDLLGAAKGLNVTAPQTLQKVQGSGIHCIAICGTYPPSIRGR